KVTLIEEEEEELGYLDVPFLSQRDPEWKDFEYDHASSIVGNPVGKQEIEEWGCALTSAAMVLKYHGYDFDLDGTNLTPASLNTYFNNNFGFTKRGGVIWNVASTFAQEAQATSSYQDLNLNSLEFEYLP